MTKKELNQILKAHSLWLKGSPDGKCANLSGADLQNSDLRNADLRNSDLRNADLRNSNLRNSDLQNADLRNSDLRNADLRNSDLRNSDLRNSDLSGADLTGADIRNSDLSGANLEGVKYDAGTSFFALVCPEEGSFIGYKKCGEYIVKLRITDTAKRSSATSRKCRCSEAEVLSITHLDGAPADILSVSSIRDSNFTYTVGETVRVDNFCDDRWRECAPGIHFFITREEAGQYR